MKYADRVLETTTTQGTGTYNLAGATTGFRTFIAAVGTAQKVPYVVDDGTNWEVGIGTLTSGSPDTLARTTILASSNSNNAVNWGSGTRNVRLAPVADIVLQRDENKNFVAFHAGTSAGAANVQTATLTPTPLAYSTGMMFSVKAGYANTAAMTLNLNSLGAKNVKLLSGADPYANAMVTSGVYIFIYDGTNLVLLNPSPVAFTVLAYAADTGSANAYAVAPNPAIAAYATGQTVILRPANANTGASTLNVNGLGTKNIKLSDGSDPVANAMTTTGVYMLTYDGTNFVIQNPELSARINPQTGTTYTLLASDHGKIVTCSNASAITVTVPNTLKPGFFCTVTQKGAGQVTFSAQASGALRNRSSFTKTAGRYASATIFIESNAGTAPEIYLGGDCA